MSAEGKKGPGAGAKKRALKEMAAKSDTSFDKVEMHGGDEDADVGDIIKAVQAAQAEDAAGVLSGSVPASAPAAAGVETKADGGAAADEKRRVPDVRVAVVGNVDSGKSTLIGVLTGGQLDNGRGLARSRVFVHAHELANGRTSCISHHIMGFDEEKKAVHQTVAASASAAAKSKSWKEVVTHSQSLLTFIDLAGHEKYLKTTIAGLTGSYPDYALIVINSLAGITKMTKEHLGVCLALDIPLCCVVTKVDMAPDNVLKRTKQQLFRILKSPAAKSKMPLAVRDAKDVATCVNDASGRVVPVFFISCVNGVNLPVLLDYLSQIRPRRDWSARTTGQVSVDGLGLFGAGAGSGSGAGPGGEGESKSASASASPAGFGARGSSGPTEFSIDETFMVTGVGIVLSGTVTSGSLRVNQTLLLGPHPDNSFKEVVVRSIHCKRVAVDECSAGDSCSVSIRPANRKNLITRQQIRRGMVLVDPAVEPRAVRSFLAEVHVLHHPTTIKLHYQAVIHCGIIRQSAAIEEINKEALRTGDNAVCRFRFLLRAEYMHEGMTFIFREGNTKGIGRVIKLVHDDKDKDAVIAPAPAAAAEAKEDGAKAPATATGTNATAKPAPKAAA